MCCFIPLGGVQGWTVAHSTSHNPSDRGKVKGQMSWPANQNHFQEEINSIILDWELPVLYSVPAAEVDVFSSSVIRLRVGGHVTSLGLHDASIPPQTSSIFFIFDTSIKRWISHAMMMNPSCTQRRVGTFFSFILITSSQAKLWWKGKNKNVLQQQVFFVLFCFLLTASKPMQTQTEYQTNRTQNNEEQEMGDAVSGRK